MPRDGSGVLTAPPGIRAVAGDVIASAQFNAFLDDYVAVGNLTHPIAKGGTGGTTVATAQTALGLVPMSSTTDTTAGRLALLGMWGWGGTTGVATPGDNCNNINRTGVYNADVGTTSNLPSAIVSGAVIVLHFHRSGDSAIQFAAKVTSSLGVFFYRSRNSAGTWSDWSYHDPITETGSGVNGTYRKRASGWIDCEATLSFSSGVASGYYGGFRCGAQTWTFPTAFASAPQDIQISVVNNTAFGAVFTGDPSTTAVDFAVTTIASASSATRKVRLSACGV